MKPTTWEPRPGWLLLTPVKLPEKTEGGLHLPDSFTTKATSGICIKAGTDVDKEVFLSKECYFPKHQEYQILDTDNGVLYYVVDANHIMLWRAPTKPSQFFRVRSHEQTIPPLTHHD